MSSISRKLKRNIAKNIAEKNGLKPNKQYSSKEEKFERKSGLKIAFEKLFGGGK